MRWNDAEHVDLVARARPRAARVTRRLRPQSRTIIGSNTRAPRPRTRRSRRRRRTCSAGRLTLRALRAAHAGPQVHGQRYYRCRYPSEYARQPSSPTPSTSTSARTTSSQIDDWLAEPSTPTARRHAAISLLDPTADRLRSTLRGAGRDELSDCDRSSPSTGRSSTPAPTPPRRRLDQGGHRHPTGDRAETRQPIADSRMAPSTETRTNLLREIGGLVGLLADCDQPTALASTRRSEPPGPTNPRSTGPPPPHTLLGIWFVSEGGLEPTFTGPMRTAGSGRNGS